MLSLGLSLVHTVSHFRLIVHKFELSELLATLEFELSACQVVVARLQVWDTIPRLQTIRTRSRLDLLSWRNPHHRVYHSRKSIDKRKNDNFYNTVIRSLILYNYSQSLRSVALKIWKMYQKEAIFFTGKLFAKIDRRRDRVKPIFNVESCIRLIIDATRWKSINVAIRATYRTTPTNFVIQRRDVNSFYARGDRWLTECSITLSFLSDNTPLPLIGSTIIVGWNRTRAGGVWIKQIDDTNRSFVKRVSEFLSLLFFFFSFCSAYSRRFYFCRLRITVKEDRWSEH